MEVLEKEIEERGSFLIAKPGRFLFHYQGKNERKYLSDGERLWIWRAVGRSWEEVGTISGMMSQEALTFLNGLGEMEKEFHVQEQSEEKVLRLLLKPRNLNSPFRRLVLVIDSDSYLAKEVFLFPKNGNRSHYLFLDLKREENLPDKVFSP